MKIYDHRNNYQVPPKTLELVGSRRGPGGHTRAEQFKLVD